MKNVTRKITGKSLIMDFVRGARMGGTPSNSRDYQSRNGNRMSAYERFESRGSKLSI